LSGLSFGVSWRVLVFSVVVGVCISLVTGFVENSWFGKATIPEIKYYGYPFSWRISDPFVGESYDYLKVFADSLFWAVIVFLVVLLAKKLARKSANITANTTSSNMFQ
jgi:hypothetical protein